MGDKVDQLVMSHIQPFSDSELSPESNAGSVQEVRERLHPFPVAALEEGTRLKAIRLLRHGLGEVIGGQVTQSLPEIAGHGRNGQLAKAEPSGYLEGIAIVILGAALHQALLEFSHELGIGADQFQLEDLQQRRGAQAAVARDPQHGGRFPANLDAGVTQVDGRQGKVDAAD
jgi:hypothetical protein